MKEISPDASARLYTDMLAGEKSILRKVFGIPIFYVSVICFSNYKHAYLHTRIVAQTDMLDTICLL